MDESAIKAHRVMLRLVQDHLLSAHRLLGAAQEGVGMVDVLYHPARATSELNYVTPRKNTAWVPTAYVDQGLRVLRERDRAARFQYLEGLFPPQFAETLSKIGLEPTAAVPLYVYNADGIDGVVPARPSPALPDGVRIRAAGMGRTRRLWDAAASADGWSMLTAGPLPTADAATLSRHVDLLAYSNRQPVGLVRLDLEADTRTCWLVALAVADDAPADLPRALVAAAVRGALRRGARLIFATTAVNAAPYLDLEFAGSARIARFAIPADVKAEPEHEPVAQPVLAGR